MQPPTDPFAMSHALAAAKHGLSHCPSRPHRAVLGLLRAAMGPTVDGTLLDDLIGDLKASDPQELVRLSVNYYVHVVLSKAFENAPDLAGAVPDDLVIFFSEMRNANLRRNQDIKAQLLTIADGFSEMGLRGVVLKGGVELLAPLYPDPAFRFLSDLDILVAEDSIDRAVARLHDLGAVSEPQEAINQRGHHHREPLHHPDWPVPVELHRSFGSAQAEGILRARDVLAAARASGMPGLDLPAPSDRLTHAVLHAQIEPPRYRDGLLSLRDLMEMEVMVRRYTRAEIAEAKARFARAGTGAAWDALDAARVLMFGQPDQCAELPAAARAWSEGAFARFGQPRRRQLALIAHLSRYYLRAILFDPERRRHYLRQILRPGRLRAAIAYQREKFRRNP